MPSVGAIGNRTSSWPGRVSSPVSAFFQAGRVLTGLGLLLGIVPQEAAAGPIDPDLELAAETLHGRATGTDARRAVQVLDRFGAGPVGPVQALLGRLLDDPAANHLLGHRWRDLGLCGLGLAGMQPGQTEFEAGLSRRWTVRG